MKSSIVTIFPTPCERYVATRPALTGASPPPAAEGPTLVKGAVETLPSIESVILQKLLAELEARQTTRAQPTYIIEPSRPAQNVILRRVLWGSCWLLSIALAALAVNYVDTLRAAEGAASGDHQSRSMEELSANLARQTDAFTSVTSSLQQLATVIASTANRTVTIREAPQAHADPLQQEHAAVVNQAAPAAPEPAVPVIIGNSAPKTDSSPIPMGGHVHPPIEWAVAPANAIVHHDSMGVMDYWLMPRMIGGVTVMTKVVPVMQDNSGIVVHDVAEAKDYLVTPSGDWVEMIDSDEKK
jgi:hypothetical protein